MSQPTWLEKSVLISRTQHPLALTMEQGARESVHKLAAQLIKLPKHQGKTEEEVFQEIFNK